MKINHLLTLPLLLAATGLLSTAPLARAITPVALSYAAGDLFLGFRQTGGTHDYLVKLGPAATFKTATTTPVALTTIGDIKADLDTIFGPDWKTDGALSWSVSGTTGTSTAPNDGIRTMYASKAEATVGTLAPAWKTSISQGTPAGKMSSMGNFYASVSGVSNLSTANSAVGYKQAVGATNSYASYQPGGTTTNSGPAPGISFAYFNPSVEGSFANGTAGTALDLFRLPQIAVSDGEYICTFVISDTGVVSYFKRSTAVTAAAPTLTSFSYGSNSATIVGLGTIGADYIIQRSVDLSPANSWLTLATVRGGGGGILTYTDNAAPAVRAFYRYAIPTP